MQNLLFKNCEDLWLWIQKSWKLTTPTKFFILKYVVVTCYSFNSIAPFDSVNIFNSIASIGTLYGECL